jgi:hypothetical protein
MNVFLGSHVVLLSRLQTDRKYARICPEIQFGGHKVIACN